MGERAVGPEDDYLVGWKTIACFLLEIPPDRELTDSQLERLKKRLYRTGLRFARLGGDVYATRAVLIALRDRLIGTR